MQIPPGRRGSHTPAPPPHPAQPAPGTHVRRRPAPLACPRPASRTQSEPPTRRNSEESWVPERSPGQNSSSGESPNRLAEPPPKEAQMYLELCALGVSRTICSSGRWESVRLLTAPLGGADARRPLGATLSRARRTRERPSRGRPSATRLSPRPTERRLQTRGALVPSPRESRSIFLKV